MSTARQALGALGERIAARWLRMRGWEVLAHRFRSGHRDVDLVVSRGGEEGRGGRLIAFVEVKTRRSAEFGGPVGAVGWRKQRELSRSAAAWLAAHCQPGDLFRFDVIGVIVTGDSVRVRHVENAFHLVRRT